MIAALIPAYNAGAMIGDVVRAARRHVPRLLVVDDGSADATAQAAEAAGAAIVRHAANRGKGAALRTGFGRLLDEGAEAIVTLDADGQHDPADIPRFLEAFHQRHADLIVGSRAAAFRGMTRGRRIGNRFSCRALRFFTGLEVPDSQSGYRLHGADFLRSFTLRRDAYDAEMEVLLHAARRGRRIETIPIRVREADGTPTSSFRPWVDTYRICRTVVFFASTQM